MTNRIQYCLAGTLSMFAAIALVGVFYLAFVFPETVAKWHVEGRTLSVAEQSLSILSNLCTSYGFFLVPELLLVIIGCGVLAFLAGARCKRENAIL